MRARSVADQRSVGARIPKKPGSDKKRPLGIPTMTDRAMQALHQMALEPVAETLADANSYGFRPYRALRDAIGQCFCILGKKISRATWILEADIQACFDGISHAWMLKHIVMDRGLLRQWLKSGYIWEKQLFETREGTPQGGPLSPTLCNRVLDGLESTIQAAVPKRQVVHFVRYADDFIVAAESKELLESVVRPAIEAFLAERGLRLSPEKTKLTRIDEGFDFLGKNVRKFKDKLIITPSRKNVRAICAKIRAMVRKCRGHSAAELIRRLNPIILGWANSHNTVQAAKAFDVVDRVLFDAVWRWSLRSHPKKNKGWIYGRYYQRRGRNGWGRFGVTERDKKGKLVRLELAKPRDVPLVRYIKIRARSNPHDAKDRDYFIMRRRAKNYKELPSAARKGKSTQSPKPPTTNHAGSAPPRAS